MTDPAVHWPGDNEALCVCVCVIPTEGVDVKLCAASCWILNHVYKQMKSFDKFCIICYLRFHPRMRLHIAT